jgi:molecular chaperone DnaJ
MRDFYKDLELSSGASDEDIKKSYRRLAIKYHPDKNAGSKESEEKFKTISEAYQILSDKSKRAEFDRGPSTYVAPDFDLSSMFSNQTFSDIFYKASEFFGEAFGKKAGKRAEDIELVAEVTLEEIYKGATFTVDIKTRVCCSGCNGKGGLNISRCEKCSGRGKIFKILSTLIGSSKILVECDKCDGAGEFPDTVCDKCYGKGSAEETVRTKTGIPQRWTQFQSVIKYKGHYKKGLKDRGDLILKFKIKEHELFDLDGTDVIYVHEESISKVICGGQITVPTIGGNATLNIGKNSIGKKYRLAKKGINGGNMIVTIDVFIPRFEDLDKSDYFDINNLSNKFNP